MHNVTFSTKQIKMVMDSLWTLKQHYVSLIVSGKYSPEQCAEIQQSIYDTTVEMDRLDAIYVGPSGEV